jgi:hypothetical protein
MKIYGHAQISIVFAAVSLRVKISSRQLNDSTRNYKKSTGIVTKMILYARSIPIFPAEMLACMERLDVLMCKDSRTGKIFRDNVHKGGS